MSSKFQTILIIVGLLTAVVAGKIWYDSSDDYLIINYPPQGSTIVAFGDSLTVGVGASSPSKGYVSILEERLGTPIIHKGIIGNTTEDALQRLDADVLTEKPNIVLVLLGSNDYLKGVEQQVTFDNLRSITERLQAEGALVVLIGARGGLLNDKFSSDFEKLAKEKGTLLVPEIMEGIIGETSLMSDVIHPNDAGYLKMADKIAPVLLEVLYATKSREGKAQ